MPTQDEHYPDFLAEIDEITANMPYQLFPDNRCIEQSLPQLHPSPEDSDFLDRQWSKLQALVREARTSVRGTSTEYDKKIREFFDQWATATHGRLFPESSEGMCYEMSSEEHDSPFLRRILQSPAEVALCPEPVGTVSYDDRQLAEECPIEGTDLSDDLLVMEIGFAYHCYLLMHADMEKER